MRSLFIYNTADLHAAVPGGVQRCTREFLAIVEAASDTVTQFTIDYDRSFLTKLKRRTGLFPYLQYDPDAYEEALAAALSGIDVAFLNRSDLVRFVEVIHRVAPFVEIVLMSHGNESGDLVYECAVEKKEKHRNYATRLYDYLLLGGNIVTEARARHSNRFTVCAMSDQEEIIEQWLGSSCTFVLPRIVELDPVEWCPAEFCAGYVGSLHHTPNIVALEAVFSCLSEHDLYIPIEVVGCPPTRGEALAAKYSFVRYVGALDQQALEQRACHWSVFLNPIFWLSKGASMKLAQALGWGLPVLTTSAGRRGYEIPDDCVITIRNDPQDFVRGLRDIRQDFSAARAVRSRLLASADSLPSIRSLGDRLHKFLESRITRDQTFS